MIIVGLDGLDPDLVERWKMDWFKQRSYGRHYVGILSRLCTPLLWGCFLTGINVEEYGYSYLEFREKKREDAFKSKVLYRLYLLRRRVPLRRLGLRKLLLMLGLVNPYPPAIMPPHLLKKTFLEELRIKGYSIVAIEVPGYSETKNEYYRCKLDELVLASFNERSRLIKEALEDTRERIVKATTYIREKYDVIFVYSPLPDLALHLGVNPDLKIKLWLRSIHYSLFRTIQTLLRLAEKEGNIVLIVSDHGFDIKKYYHSEYGFWSLNIEPPRWWRISSILDFKRNILKLFYACKNQFRNWKS